MELVKWGANAGSTTATFLPFQLVPSGNKPFPDEILHRAPGVPDLFRNRMTEIHRYAEQGKISYILHHSDLQRIIESEDSYGETPLHYAARFGQNEVIETLLDLDCKIESVDNWGFTPLHCACEGGYSYGELGAGW
jgi:ankyrin repeat protein